MYFFPVITFILLVLGCYRRFASWISLREAFLMGAVLWGIVLVFITEYLSAYQVLSFPYLSVLWIVMTLAGLVFCVFLPSDKSAGKDHFDLKKKIVRSFKDLSRIEIVMLVLIAAVLFLVGLTAFTAPPNNWDSLVYHMGRVGHWLQNRTIAHYPTNIKPQIYYPPFAEWAILHFQILSGSDHFANCIQWFSLLGSTVASTLIARFLGAARRGQILAALLTVTVPMAIVQGSSTQNDLVLSFWLSVFVYFGLRVIKSGWLLDALIGGAALGLAVLTKALASILAFPFMIWFFIAGFKKFRLNIIAPLLLALLLAGILNFGHWKRNFELSGNILGEAEVYGITRNDRMSPALFVSNVLRNTGLHLATSIKPLNRWSEKQIEHAHEFIKLSPVDPDITLGNVPLQISVSTHEDGAGNFLQLVLILCSLSIFLIRREKGREAWAYYIFCLFVAIVLFNLFLRWQASGSRLHLPVFILFMPFVALIISSLKNKQILALCALTAFLVATSVPYVFRNSTRKLFSSKRTVFALPRLQQYFVDDDTLLKPYQEAVDRVEVLDCHEVGVRIGDNAWEYPLFVLLRNTPQNKVRLEQVDITGIKPLNYPLGGFHPCAIIETGRPVPPEGKMRIDGKVFKLQNEGSPVRVYTPA